MFKVFKDTEFSAAHSLRRYKGKCESLHGHNWKVRLQLKTQELDSLGMAIDFEEIKEALGTIIAKLDHQNLNEISPFDKINPTSENIARYIFEEASEILCTEKINLDRVMVWEKPSSCAIYKADKDVKSK